eukprot:8778192-Pyramimonas_sp.AAC.1
MVDVVTANAAMGRKGSELRSEVNRMGRRMISPDDRTLLVGGGIAGVALLVVVLFVRPKAMQQLLQRWDVFKGQCLQARRPRPMRQSADESNPRQALVFVCGCA